VEPFEHARSARSRHSLYDDIILERAGESRQRGEGIPLPPGGVHPVGLFEESLARGDVKVAMERGLIPVDGGKDRLRNGTRADRSVADRVPDDVRGKSARIHWSADHPGNAEVPSLAIGRPFKGRLPRVASPCDVGTLSGLFRGRRPG